MSRRVLAWGTFGSLLAAAGAWCAYGSPSGPRTVRWPVEPPRISPEARRSPLVAQSAPEPVSLIRSIEVTRPLAPELMVIKSPGQPRSAPAEAPPVCDAAPLALLRTGCPDAPPAVQLCPEEGQECRYAVEADCVAQYECVYGLWSPVGVVCPDGEPGQGQLLEGSGQCEEHTPVADAPCADEGVTCGHLPCEIGGRPKLIAECRCGRWYQRWQACPID